MKYAQVNSFSNGSTGALMFRMRAEREALGDECRVFWGRGRDAANQGECRFATRANVLLDALLTRMDDRAGFHSRAATRRLLDELDRFDPDIVHLHNLHGYYVNTEMLFTWLAKRNQQTIWTLHDCWAFTGHCAHFTYANCNQWKSPCGCLGPCPQKGEYPKAVFASACKRNFDDKRRLFTLLPADRMTLIAPSRWLAGLVADSFLANYPVEVRPNEIDRTVFKPTPSDVRDRFGIGDRFIILGVASPWTQRKGLDDFIRLAADLDDAFAIVLVGLSEGQIRALPAGVVGIPRTDSPQKLAEFYTSADIFFNPTGEDNYPTVNLEAEACGTPVITYDTGGCRETLHDSRSAAVASYESARELLIRARESKGSEVLNG